MSRPTRWFASRCARTQDRIALAVLAAVAYLPIVLTSPGRVSADTKTYLTLDPGELLRQAPSMWDPSVGAGTVPHQNIGYLFPLGPFYWVMERLAVPDWLTQRLIWGTLVFAAAAGTYRLARWLGWRVVGAFVAAFAYGCSPYVFSYLARLSVILGPWAALPWMILLAALAVRTRSWRPAALFALVVALVGSVNATALVLAGLGPLLWMTCDVIAGRVALRPTLAAVARIGVLSAAVSLWWIVALRVQGTYGLAILDYTETYQAVASASTPTEIVRGLGYWFYYGGDRLDPWVGPSTPYIDDVVLIGVGFLVAGVSLLGLLTRFAGRVNAAVLLLVGLAVAVGAAPLGASTIYGSLFEWLAEETTAGMALRSTPRAAPLVILALAFGLAAATEWIRQQVVERRLAASSAASSAASPAASPTASSVAGPTAGAERRLDLLVPVVVVALLAVQFFPWFTGRALTPSLLRDEHLPGYITDLAAWLDRDLDGDRNDGDRNDDGGGLVYELPAADFANHRWGGTVDPVLPGIIERPYLSRELVPQGGVATADLLNALERRLPEGWFEPESLLPVARLLGVQTVVVRNDLEHERYRLARPGITWTEISGALGEPDHAGPTIEDTPRIPILDERTLAHPEAATSFPAVAAFDLGATAVARAVSANAPVVLSGSGDGVVDLAGAGLLDPDRPLLYAATLDDLGAAGDLDPAAIGPGTWWVLSDTNRKQGRHWSTVSSNLGAVEASGPLSFDDDPGDSRLDVFLPGADRQTVGRHLADVADVRASYYGNRIAFTPEDAPWFAIDGDPTTAWRAGVFDTTEGLVWEVELDEPVAADHLTVLQPTTGAVNRFVTAVDVVLDERDPIRVTLDERSRTAPGQRVELPTEGAFSTVRIEIVADNVGRLSNYGAQPGVGFAEITIPGVVDDRVVSMPGLDAFPDLPTDDVADQRVTVMMTRDRIDPATSNRTSPEPAINRRFDTPDTRTYELTAEVRLSADAADDVLAAVVPNPIGAIADRRLPGAPAAAGASAFDGDPGTAWQTPFDDVVGATVTVTLPDTAGSVDAGSLRVEWLDDGQHSVPTQLTLTDAAGTSQTVPLPPTAPVEGRAGATVDIAPPAPGPLAVTISGIDARTTPEYFSGLPQVLPVALSELQFGDAPNAARDVASPIGGECRDDLVLLDGEPLAVRIDGTVADALGRRELTMVACGPVDLAAGEHRLEALPGALTGFDVDRVVLDGPSPAADAAPPGPAPATVTEVSSSTAIDVSVAPSPEASWLILGQSWNAGWRATVAGDDLGAPVLIDGFANGWLLPPADDERVVELRWEPQRTVTLALWFSLAAGVVVLAIALLPRRRRADTAPVVAAGVVPRRSNGVAAVCGGVLAVALVAVAGVVPTVVAAVCVVAARRWAWLPTALVVGLGTVVAGVVMALEFRRDYPADPDWPSRFGWVSPLTWTVVAVVVTMAIVPRLWPSTIPGERRRESAEQ